MVKKFIGSEIKATYGADPDLEYVLYSDYADLKFKLSGREALIDVASRRIAALEKQVSKYKAWESECATPSGEVNG